MTSMHKPSVVGSPGRSLQSHPTRQCTAQAAVRAGHEPQQLATSRAGHLAAPDNPTVYGTIEVDMTESLALIERLRAWKAFTSR